jgi:hypothetical protein
MKKKNKSARPIEISIYHTSCLFPVRSSDDGEHVGKLRAIRNYKEPFLSDKSQSPLLATGPSLTTDRLPVGANGRFPVGKVVPRHIYSTNSPTEGEAPMVS